MEKTRVRGKDILVPTTPVAIFSLLTDLNALIGRLPEEHRDKVTINGDKVNISAQGMNISFEIAKKEPFSVIGFKSIESPIPFETDFLCEPVGLDQTLFHIEFACELNFMTKMIVGGKLQDAVDKISEQIEMAIKQHKV